MARKTPKSAASAAAPYSEGGTAAPAAVEAKAEGSSPSVDQAGGVSPAADGAATVSAASNDTPRSEDQGGPAAPSAEASVSADVLSVRDNEVLLGSSILPALIDLGGGETVQLGEIVMATHHASGLSCADWNDAPEDIRERALALMVDAGRQAAALKGRFAALFAGAPEGLISITAKSKDGKPFRRAGIGWTADYATHLVTDEAALILMTEPRLAVEKSK